MGRYNPSAPIILGQEWVGIRDESVQFSPLSNAFEQGHTFTTTAPYVLQDGRFYVREMPPNLGDSVYAVGIYPAGGEALSGPVQRVVIPVQSAYVTGVDLGGSAGVVASLFTPYLGTNYLAMDTSDPYSWVSLGFNTAPYTILNGKRIVRVSLLFSAEASYTADEGIVGPFIVLGESPLMPALGSFLTYADGADIIPRPSGGVTASLSEPIRVDLGETCLFWNPGAGSTNPEALPWTFADLRRFDPDTPGTRLYINFASGSNAGAIAGTVLLWYAALEVLYCEETRVVVGASQRASRSGTELQYGANPVRLRSVADRSLNPTLPAGSWTVTASILSRGDRESDVGYPDLNALRELYQIPSHQGRQVLLTQTVGHEFSVAATHVLPQLSLHASGGILTEPHAYGTQWAAPVYGSVTATQEIRDDTAGVAAQYPQMRFWARHWTGTTQALQVSGLGTVAGSNGSISVAEFDALPTIRDGWAEVNLRLSAIPTMGASSPDPQWMWLSPAEAAGSRWEVLAVRAPAVSGNVAGDLLNLLNPTTQRPDLASYEPPVGATIELTTISAYASGGPAAQSDIDACVLFSQDPYTVTGLTLTALSQALTGVVNNCAGDTPCCMATAISYNRVTWPALAMSSSGFGAFELQRWDEITGDWQTIMSASSASVTGFNDYEARVGVASVYRIRVINLYRFAGAWSAQVTGTITAPGATVGCGGENTPIGILIFTTNSEQSGAGNLAYVPTWGRAPEESFTFPEAQRSQLRWQYQRDFQTAYRPTERGGEMFSRQLLLEGVATAIDRPSMHALNDLAWADLPYVCVRDDRGNRWFANVDVPSGVISQQTPYVAQVDITEVSGTPTEVNP